MGYKKKVDTAQAPMVSELRKCGFLVEDLHGVGKSVPDLVVTGYSIRHGLTLALWVEVKSPGGKLSEGQKEYIKIMEDKFPGMDIPLIVAEDSKQVLVWFGKG